MRHLDRESGAHEILEINAGRDARSIYKSELELAAVLDGLSEESAFLGHRQRLLGLLVLEAREEADDAPVHPDMAAADRRP